MKKVHLFNKAYYNLGLGYMYTDQFDQARISDLAFGQGSSQEIPRLKMGCI